MQIFITRNGEKFGPYTLEQVQTHLNSGHIHANDMAWYEGALNWMPLSQVPNVQIPLSKLPPSLPLNQTAPPVTTKPKSGKAWIGFGIAAFILYSIVSPVIRRANIDAQQRERRLAQIDARLEAGNIGMRKSFDEMETTVSSNPYLKQRVRDLRIEWEEGKDNSQKLEVVIEKLKLLSKDIEEANR